MRSLFLKIFLWFWVAMVLTVLVFATVVANTQPKPGSAPRDAYGPGSPQHARGHTALLASLQTAAELMKAGGMGALARYLNDLERTKHAHVLLLDRHGKAVSWRTHADSSKATSPLAPTREQNAPPPLPADMQRRLAALAQRVTKSSQATPETELPDDVFGGAQQIRAPAGAAYVLAIALPVENTDAMRADAPAGSEPDDRSMEQARMEQAQTDASDFRPGDRPHGPPPWIIGVSRLAGLLLFGNLETQLIRLLAILTVAGLVCYLLARHLTTPIVQLRAATHRLAGGELSTRVGGLARRKDEMGLLGRDFDQMAERIESLVNAQNRLIADVSHELRSPLARLGMALELVRKTAGADAMEDLDLIEHESERLNAIIGQLLILSRLESGGQKPANTLVDMAPLVASVCEDADSEARGRGCAVRVQGLESCVVMGTEPLLRSAVENVVRNAARYTGVGTVVDVNLGREPGSVLADGVGTATEREHDLTQQHIVIRVRDYGTGVPDEVLPYLFQPFYRVEGARDRQSGGAGLGLAITEGAVRLHGGTIKASNAAPGGLMVEIRLPLTELDPVS